MGPTVRYAALLFLAGCTCNRKLERYCGEPGEESEDCAPLPLDAAENRPPFIDGPYAILQCDGYFEVLDEAWGKDAPQLRWYDAVLRELTGVAFWSYGGSCSEYILYGDAPEGWCRGGGCPCPEAVVLAWVDMPYPSSYHTGSPSSTTPISP